MNKEQLIEAVKNIPIIAEREGWALTLDKEEGALFYAPGTIPAGSQLHQVTDEYALYTDIHKNPTGVVVEYYRANFLKHHTAFNKVSADIFGIARDNEVITINSKELRNNQEAGIFKALLESTLIKEAGAALMPA